MNGFKVPGSTQSATLPSSIPSALAGADQAQEKLLKLGINWLFIAAGLLAVIFLLWSGIQYITSAGDANRLAAAKQRLIYSIVGLIVVIGSYVIVNTVFRLLGVAGSV